MVSCFIIRVERPQLLVICLLFQSGLMVIYSGLIGGVWYAYILFLVFLGGILILFVYASSLTSEIKLDYNTKKYFLVFFRGIAISLLIWLNRLNTSLVSIENSNFEGDSMKELISEFRWVLYLYVVGYLLLTLYNVCWVIKIFEGPFQKFN